MPRPAACCRRFLLAAPLAMLAAAEPAAAQWSIDPAANLVLADGASEQVQAKMVPLADGGFYVSWFDNASGGYDVRLQRLSAAGVELWAHNGILVADRGLSSTTDYGLAVDAEGNALLAFNDDSQATERIVASKIDPDGAPLWGTPGIAVSTYDGFLASPRIAGTDDGQAVVGWIQGGATLDTVLQRLDADGVKQWAADGLVLAHTGDNFLLADLQASGPDVVVSWVRYVTFQGEKHLWAQKLDAAGAAQWGAGHVQVFDLAGGSLQFGNFPELVSAAGGGAVFAWYTSTPALQVRAQRLLSNGDEVFAHNGVELSTDTTRSRTGPGATFDVSSGEITVFWVETNALQSLFGLYGQRLDAAGNRLWGATGREIVPLGGQQLSQARALTVADLAAAAPAGSIHDALVAWVATEAFDDQPIFAARLDPAGDFVWTPPSRAIKSSNSGTSRLASAKSSDGFAAFAWTDGEGARDLLAQNLYPAGWLGTPPFFADGFESANTTAWDFTAP